MLTKRCNNSEDEWDSDDDRNNIKEELSENIGRVITVFTKSGGCSGNGFTGLLTEVNRQSIRLISSFSSAPRHPFGRDFDDCDRDRDRNRDRDCDRDCDRDRNRRRDCDRFGTVIIIPIRSIVAFVFNEV